MAHICLTTKIHRPDVTLVFRSVEYVEVCRSPLGLSYTNHENILPQLNAGSQPTTISRLFLMYKQLPVDKSQDSRVSTNPNNICKFNHFPSVIFACRCELQPCLGTYPLLMSAKSDDNDPHCNASICSLLVSTTMPDCSVPSCIVSSCQSAQLFFG